ncbi:MAG: hypothetical protein QGH83_09480, partial [Candidatus Pacebacteria bacterium]|nr:hypothetical protein [Candidatus Paceibacterota bacterium]
IASASPLVIDTDGDYFDVTGTTNFAAMTVAADRQFTLQFDGALTMTHHATNLDLPGEANITTAAGDVATFQSTGSNTVQCISYVKADGTAVVGSVEGTAVLSTGEAGGTKFLREDGDGTSSWQTAGGGGWIELQTVTASDSATVDLETSIGSTYDEYMIKVSNMHSANDAPIMQIRLKVGGSYQTTGYYSHTMISDSAAATYEGIDKDDATAMELGYAGNAANENLSLTIYFSAPDSTDNFKHIYYSGGCIDHEGNARCSFGTGYSSSSGSALTGVRCFVESGNISSGIFTLYGLTKA